MTGVCVELLVYFWSIIHKIHTAGLKSLRLQAKATQPRTHPLQTTKRAQQHKQKNPWIREKCSGFSEHPSTRQVPLRVWTYQSALFKSFKRITTERDFVQDWLFYLWLMSHIPVKPRHLFVLPYERELHGRSNRRRKKRVHLIQSRIYRANPGGSAPLDVRMLEDGGVLCSCNRWLMLFSTDVQPKPDPLCFMF